MTSPAPDGRRGSALDLPGDLGQLLTTDGLHLYIELDFRGLIERLFDLNVVRWGSVSGRIRKPLSIRGRSACCRLWPATQIGGQLRVNVGVVGHRYGRPELAFPAARLGRCELRECFECLHGKVGVEFVEPPGGVREIPGMDRELVGVGVQGNPAGQRGPRQRDHSVEHRVVGPHPLDLVSGLGECARPAVVGNAVDHVGDIARVDSGADAGDLVQHRDHMPEQRANICMTVPIRSRSSAMLAVATGPTGSGRFGVAARASTSSRPPTMPLEVAGWSGSGLRLVRLVVGPNDLATENHRHIRWVVAG